MFEAMRTYLESGFPTFSICYTVSMIAFWGMILLTIISVVYFIQVGLKKRTSTRRYEILITICYTILFGLLVLGFHGMDQYALM